MLNCCSYILKELQMELQQLCPFNALVYQPLYELAQVIGSDTGLAMFRYKPIILLKFKWMNNYVGPYKLDRTKETYTRKAWFSALRVLVSSVHSLLFLFALVQVGYKWDF